MLKRNLPEKIRAPAPIFTVSCGALLMLLSSAVAHAAGTQYDAAALPLVAVAKSLADSPPDYRAEFARIALEEMANAYDEEVARANAQLANPPQRKKKRDSDAETTRKARRDLARWAAATSDYARRLREMSHGIGDFTDVTIVVEAHDELRLVFNGQSIIVSGPRIDKPGPLNARIVNRFCFIYSCDAALPRGAGPGDEPADGSSPGGGYYSNVDTSPSGHWSFAQNRKPTFITPNGLRFTYDDTSNLREKETRSLALAADLDLVARTLKALRRQGTPIDWNRLSMVPTGEGTRQKITFNAHQDSVVINLPALANAPTIWQSSLPWLRQQVDPDVAPPTDVPDTGRATPPAQTHEYIERIPIDR